MLKRFTVLTAYIIQTLCFTVILISFSAVLSFSHAYLTQVLPLHGTVFQIKYGRK
jgi:hypothetical protein